MDDDDCVLPRLNYFIEIADCTRANGTRERAILPYRGVIANEKTPHQIGGGQIVMAGYNNQRSLQVPRHMFDKTRFSTTCRSFQHYSEVTQVALRENAYLLSERKVIGFFPARLVGALVRMLEIPELGQVFHYSRCLSMAGVTGGSKVWYVRAGIGRRNRLGCGPKKIPDEQGCSDREDRCSGNQHQEVHL